MRCCGGQQSPRRPCWVYVRSAAKIDFTSRGQMLIPLESPHSAGRRFLATKCPLTLRWEETGETRCDRMLASASSQRFLFWRPRLSAPRLRCPKTSLHNEPGEAWQRVDRQAAAWWGRTRLLSPDALEKKGRWHRQSPSDHPPGRRGLEDRGGAGVRIRSLDMALRVFKRASAAVPAWRATPQAEMNLPLH